MINNTTNELIRGCHDLLADTIKSELESTPGMRVDLDDCSYAAISCDGEPKINRFTAVYVKGGVVLVEYEDYYQQYRDPIDLFTIDELSEILSCM